LTLNDKPIASLVYYTALAHSIIKPAISVTKPLSIIRW